MLLRLNFAGDESTINIMSLLNPLVVNPTALITYYLLLIASKLGTMDDFGEGIVR